MRLAQQQEERSSQGPLTRLPITFRVENLKTTLVHQKSISNPNHGNRVENERSDILSVHLMSYKEGGRKWVQWRKTHAMNLNFKTEKKMFGHGFYSLQKDSEEE